MGVLPSVHPPEDRRTSVGRTKTDFSKHTKTFPRKKLAVTTGKKLVDLRDAAFKLLFEVVQKPSGGCLPSPSNCYRPNAWVLVVQLGCETLKRRIISKVHPKHISIKHMVCRKCYITIEFSFPFFLKLRCYLQLFANVEYSFGLQDSKAPFLDCRNQEYFFCLIYFCIEKNLKIAKKKKKKKKK